MIQISIDIAEDSRQLIVTERMPYLRDKVWLVHTEALYLKQWWAPTGYANALVETNPVPGGTWRVVQRDPEGNSFGFYGRYHEVDRPSKLTQSRTSEIFPDAPTELTLEFTEIPDGTQVVTTQVFQTEVNLQGFLKLGGIERIREASLGLNELLSQM